MRRYISCLVLIVVPVLGGCEERRSTPPAENTPAPQVAQAPAPKPQSSVALESPPAQSPDQKMDKAWEQLAKELGGKLPPGKTVAVLPLMDPSGGARRLGVLAAEGIQRHLLAGGVKVVDRQNVNALLAEKSFQMTNLVSSKSLDQAGQLVGAEILVVGNTAESGRDVLLTAKALDAKTGQLLAAASNVALPADELGHLMWYVQRPAAQTAGGELPPLAIKHEFVAATDTGETRLADGATVVSGQRFKIRVQSNSDCHLYVLLYDSQGAASVLFPHAEIGMSNEIRGGVSYEVPEGSKWYWFDRQTGTETFYIVGSYTPMEDLDQILAQMQQAGKKAVQLASAAKDKIDNAVARGMSSSTSAAYQPKGFTIGERGVGGVVDIGWGGTRPESTQSLDDVVVGHATVVKKIVLRHR